MGRARRFTLAGLVPVLLLGLTGCSGATNWLAGEPPPPETPPPGATIGLVGRATWSGAISEASSPGFLVARTPAEWQALWDLAGRKPPMALPERMMALAVFMGTRNTGGYGVEIVNIRLDRRVGERDRLLVEYRERTPGRMAQQVLTSPYTITLVDRSDTPVQYARVGD